MQTIQLIQNDQLTRYTYFCVDSFKGGYSTLSGGTCCSCGEVCQSETLWRIESSSGAYGIASGAKKRDDPEGHKKKIYEKYIAFYLEDNAWDSRL